jgi:hypothetical protein
MEVTPNTETAASKADEVDCFTITGTPLQSTALPGRVHHIIKEDARATAPLPK